MGMSSFTDCGSTRNCVPMVYGNEYFFTRYPREITKMWNLIYLFTPGSWMWTLISMVSILISFFISRAVGRKCGLGANSSEELVLFPFRFDVRSNKTKTFQLLHANLFLI